VARGLMVQGQSEEEQIRIAIRESLEAVERGNRRPASAARQSRQGLRLREEEQIAIRSLFGVEGDGIFVFFPCR